jgi:hypothetical protein
VSVDVAFLFLSFRAPGLEQLAAAAQELPFRDRRFGPRGDIPHAEQARRRGAPQHYFRLHANYAQLKTRPILIHRNHQGEQEAQMATNLKGVTLDQRRLLGQRSG